MVGVSLCSFLTTQRPALQYKLPEHSFSLNQYSSKEAVVNHPGRTQDFAGKQFGVRLTASRKCFGVVLRRTQSAAGSPGSGSVAAIQNNSVTVQVTNTTFARNILGSFIGEAGIVIANFGTLSLTNSTLAENIAVPRRRTVLLLSLAGPMHGRSCKTLSSPTKQSSPLTGQQVCSRRERRAIIVSL